MTATAEFMDVETRTLQPARLVDGGRMIVRAAQRFLGASLALAAVGIWMAPGASWESDLMLFKLVLSLTAVLAGLGLMQASISPTSPEVDIDLIRREVRLLRPSRDGSMRVLQTCRFRDLSGAEVEGNHVRLLDADGLLMAEVALSERKVLSQLLSGLRDEGKLA